MTIQDILFPPGPRYYCTNGHIVADIDAFCRFCGDALPHRMIYPPCGTHGWIPLDRTQPCPHKDHTASDVHSPHE